MAVILSLVPFLFLGLMGYLLYLAYKNINSLMPEAILGHWNHHFPDLEFSALEFYSAVTTAVQERKIPDVTIINVEFSEHGELMDRQRTYLRIRNRRLVFDICAAPYADGFFISWWFGENVTLLTRILLRIPLLGTYIGNRITRGTYYAWDCQDMFVEVAHNTIMATIDAITTQKGVRGLTLEEKSSRKPVKR